MSASRRLRVLLLALLLGGLAAGGSTYLPTRDNNVRLAKPDGILPGYGGSVGEQSSGSISPTPLDEEVVVEPGAELSTTPNELEAASAPRRIQGSFMVALAPGQNPSDVAAAIARDYGGEPRAVYDEVINGFQFVGPDEARTRMVSDPRVRSVQPDYEVHVAESSANVHLAAINQPAAVNAGRRGAGIRIGILDTGADLNHTAISNRIASDSTDASAGVCTGGGSAQDSNGHGTRTTSNAVGSLGVAPDATAVVVKVFPGNSGSTSFANIACGVNYLVKLNNDATTANDVKVANASIAGGNTNPGTCATAGLHQAVCQLVNPHSNGKPGATASAAFFVAAGNSGASAANYSPGNFAESITVSAFDCDTINCTTTKPKLASWSNRGSAIEIGAPGAGIYSAKLSINSTTSTYETASGTSRASPMAAGAAAAVLNAFPSFSPAQIKSQLLRYGKCPNSATNTVAGNCTSGAWTSDSDQIAEPFLNVGAAVGSAPPPAPTAPSAPQNVRATAGNGQATVSWSPPASNGGAAIASYTVTSNPDVAATPLNTSSTSVTIAGLTNGTPYTFTVSAKNSAGLQGPGATSNSVTPAASAPVWARVQENGTGVTYSSGWTSASASCTSGGTYRYSGTAGATANFAFSGVGVRFVTAVGANLGKVELWLDGETTRTTVDTYAASQTCNTIRYTRTGLTSGSHTLHIRVTGTRNASSSGTSVIVDAFDRLA